MKIRSGFVSNSSSSSFTCDVCGRTESGYDMSFRDAGMSRCIKGHGYCNDHKESLNLTIDQIRQLLLKRINDNTFYDPDYQKEKIKKIENMDHCQLEDYFNEIDREDGFTEFCPICQMIEVDDADTIKYFLRELGYKNKKELAVYLKNKFQTYENFTSYLNKNNSI